MSTIQITEKTTRIDLETAGQGVLVSMWNEKWQEGSAPASSEYFSGAGIARLLMQAEDQGFTCEMCDPSHGRALRGEVVRIDILEVGKDWVVRKFPRGWTAKTRPLTERTLPAQEAASAIQWCKEHGWQVREFPGGARAWKYEIKPIRDASTIQLLRRQIDQALNRGEADPRRQFDLAFDC